MRLNLTPWWESDSYHGEQPVPKDFEDHAGPQGPALVKVYGSATQTGWGEKTFMENYSKGLFNPLRALRRYEKESEPFAFVMRSMSIIAVDVDGKNNGFTGVKSLGYLPPTLTETSKSGNGLHLFYAVEDTWSQTLGFHRISDAIGIAQGVDIRYTGCVYHHSTQRWNSRGIAPLPQGLGETLEQREIKRTAFSRHIKQVQHTGDEIEMLMIQTEIMDELTRPIPAGKRNSTLFALGSKMHLAGVEDWNLVLIGRGIQLGLDQEELERLCENIEKYAAAEN